MNDGNYTVNITLNGGTGRAYIVSPMSITVSGGEITARPEWSSSKYDLMIVGGKEYYPVNTDGNSVFEIPVPTLDSPLSVQAETVAMSEPHLIDYEIVFDAASVKPAGEQMNIPLTVGVSVGAVCVVAVIFTVIVKSGKKKKDD